MKVKLTVCIPVGKAVMFKKFNFHALKLKAQVYDITADPES